MGRTHALLINYYRFAPKIVIVFCKNFFALSSPVVLRNCRVLFYLSTTKISRSGLALYMHPTNIFIHAALSWSVLSDINLSTIIDYLYAPVLSQITGDQSDKSSRGNHGWIRIQMGITPQCLNTTFNLWCSLDRTHFNNNYSYIMLFCVLLIILLIAFDQLL